MQTIHRHVESAACGKTAITHRVMIALGLHTRSLKNASVHIRCIHNARTQFLRKNSAMHGGSLVCSRGSCRAGAAHPGAAPQRKLRGARRIGWDVVLADVLPQQTPFLVCGTADVEAM